MKYENDFFKKISFEIAFNNVYIFRLKKNRGKSFHKNGAHISKARMI